MAAALAQTARAGLAARALPAEGTRLALAAGLVVLGAALVLDFKGISSAVARSSSGFTPWGKKRQQSSRPNPVRAVGAFFLIGGLIALISVANAPTGRVTCSPCPACQQLATRRSAAPRGR